MPPLVAAAAEVKSTAPPLMFPVWVMRMRVPVPSPRTCSWPQFKADICDTVPPLMLRKGKLLVPVVLRARSSSVMLVVSTERVPPVSTQRKTSTVCIVAQFMKLPLQRPCCVPTHARLALVATLGAKWRSGSDALWTYS